MNIHLRASLGAVLVSLTACGGGGGGGSPGPSQAPNVMNTQAAWASFLAGGRTFTLVGSIDPVQIRYQFDAAVSDTFPLSGVASFRLRQNVTVTRSNSPSDLGYRDYFFDASNRLVGLRQFVPPSDERCYLLNSNNSMPPSAALGDSGALGQFQQYLSCATSAAATTATEDFNWSVQFDSRHSSTQFFCFRNGSTLSGTSDATELCIQAGLDGTLGSLARLRISPSDELWTP